MNAIDVYVEQFYDAPVNLPPCMMYWLPIVNDVVQQGVQAEHKEIGSEPLARDGIIMCMFSVLFSPLDTIADETERLGDSHFRQLDISANKMTNSIRRYLEFAFRFHHVWNDDLKAALYEKMEKVEERDAFPIHLLIAEASTLVDNGVQFIVGLDYLVYDSDHWPLRDAQNAIEGLRFFILSFTCCWKAVILILLTDKSVTGWKSLRDEMALLHGTDSMKNAIEAYSSWQKLLVRWDKFAVPL